MSALRVKNQYTPLSPSINPAFLSFAKPYTYRQRFGKDSNIMENEFGAVGQGMNYLLGIGGIIVVFVIYAISLYNRLVALRQNRMNAYSDIDVQLKQRFDLVPQLVDSVKGYVTHEKTVLETVTAARASVGAAHGADQRLAAEGKLGGALMGLFAVAENYPLSAIEGRSKLPAIDVRTFRYRKQNCCRAPLLQQRDKRTQHGGSTIPSEYRCGNVRL
jgi:hypothetical protein